MKNKTKYVYVTHSLQRNKVPLSTIRQAFQEGASELTNNRTTEVDGSGANMGINIYICSMVKEKSYFGWERRL